ncbi:MAG: sulfane dehydrogenase subunit SoxC, partial [Pseudohongiellaceae bacterium]
MYFKKPMPYRKFSIDRAEKKDVKDRRNFLKAGLSLTGLAAAGTVAAPLIAAEAPISLPKWSQYLGNSVDKFPYGMPSPHESEVVRRSVEWLTATRESSINFTPIHALDGILTPNGLCFERHHSGAPEIPASDHQLMINGLVDQPLMFSMEDIVRFPPETKTFFLECAANGGMEWRGAQLNGCQYTHGMIHCVQYTGVRLKTLLNECGIKAKGKWILAEGADAAGMTRSIPMDKALDD